ncbi:AAA ATPase-like protein [Krasilnikovia cinnamomea]|uniref:AAA ATPase-like protein n=2 Tax=Krasilnikovia cinnamomea TaxID=349313 RepID=A0A4Q7ZEW5_9ACTN|nr:AAA ATPase-like protein [Krasilnikovia cinnamomea]
MVGRAAALDELRRAWQRVDDGGGCLPAVLTGEPGTGKSALVGALLRDVRAGTVLAGAARLHSPAPYDWLAAVLAGRDTSALPVPPDALAWLAQHPDVPRERYTPEALLRLAVGAVRALVGTGPAVLVVEDLHALDPASLNLVGELAATDLPTLLLVTSRPPDDAVSPQLAARSLARLSGVPGAVRQHLGALDAGHVAEIIAHAYPDDAPSAHLASAVWRRTGGNPYRLTELLAMAAGRGPQALVDEPLPGYLRPDAGPDPAPEPPKELTAREREVLGCLAEGMSNKQIARALEISVRTVTVHVSNLLRKTGASSRTEVALRAVRAGTPDRHPSVHR